MKPHTEDIEDVESILHPPHLIETNDPQQNALQKELKLHVNTFINTLTLEEIISLYYSLKDKDSFNDVLQNHRHPLIRTINFDSSKEWQKLFNKSYYSFKQTGYKVQGELRAYIWALGLYNE